MKIQEVYRLQGVNINDKHIEVIVRQMLRWVKIKEVGDTEFLLEEQVDRFRYEDENRRVLEETTGNRRRPNRCCWVSPRRRFRPTRSSRQRRFQETTRVLTEAAISGRIDYLRGLKENVIMGRLIPAGTGMKYYRNVKVDFDPTVNQKEEDEYDDFVALTGGIELPPASVPLVEGDGDALDIPEPDFDSDYNSETAGVFEGETDGISIDEGDEI